MSSFSSLFFSAGLISKLSEEDFMLWLLQPFLLHKGDATCGNLASPTPGKGGTFTYSYTDYAINHTSGRKIQPVENVAKLVPFVFSLQWWIHVPFPPCAGHTRIFKRSSDKFSRRRHDKEDKGCTNRNVQEACK